MGRGFGGYDEGGEGGGEAWKWMVGGWGTAPACRKCSPAVLHAAACAVLPCFGVDLKPPTDCWLPMRWLGLQGEIAVTRRAAYAAEEAVQKMEKAKMDQDFRWARCASQAHGTGTDPGPVHPYPPLAKLQSSFPHTP